MTVEVDLDVLRDMLKRCSAREMADILYAAAPALLAVASSGAEARERANEYWEHKLSLTRALEDLLNAPERLEHGESPASMKQRVDARMRALDALEAAGVRP